MRTAKTLIRWGGCPGWSESSLGAQSVCWFCHVVAHYTSGLAKQTLFLLILFYQITNTDVIYTSEIIYPYVEPSYPSVVFGHIWKIDVTCSLPNHGQIGIQIHPDHYLSSPAPTLNQVTPVHHSLNGTSTAVSLHFHFYSDPGFVHEISGNPIHATFGDEVYVKVTHDSVDNGLKMRLETCFSRPGSGNGPIVYLIVDGWVCLSFLSGHFINRILLYIKFYLL